MECYCIERKGKGRERGVRGKKEGKYLFSGEMEEEKR